MTSKRQAVGRLGERLAAEHLTAAGFRIVERNWRCHLGEIDVVARDAECLVIVEVRTRTSETFGTPEESVGRHKQARLVALGQEYVQSTRWGGPWRIDVLAVELDATGAVKRIAHYPSAVGGE